MFKYNPLQERLSAIISILASRHPNLNHEIEDLTKSLPPSEKGQLIGEILKHPADVPLEKFNSIDNTGNGRYTLRSAEDAMKDQPPIEWIIDRLFSAGSVSLMVGAPASKKTYAMLSAAVCVALGKPWIGLPTKQGSVLFIDEESGERRMARRLKQCLLGEKGTKNTPVYYTSLARFDVRKLDDVLVIQQLIEKTLAKLVILDALADIMLGGDENAVKDVHPIFLAWRKLASDNGCAVVTIHHTNRMGDYRGSSAMEGAVDLLLQVRSEPGSPIIEFKSGKVRDTEPFVFRASAHFEGDKFFLRGSGIAAKQPNLNTTESYVVKYLTSKRSSKKSEIMSSTEEYSPGSIEDAIYSLKGKGVIKRANPDKAGRGVEAEYSLSASFQA